MPIEPLDTDPATLDAVTVKVNDPVALGVPDTTPVDELSDNPDGNDPALTLNVGAGYPDALNVYEYGAPSLIDAAGLSAVNTGTDWIVIESDAEVTDPNTLPAEIVKVDVPVVVGVPDNTPVLELRLSPAGNDPDATLNVAAGYPDAANVYEYAVPDTPVDGGDTAVNTGTDPTVIEIDPDDTDPAIFEADTLNAYTPDVVGVPDNTPLDVFNDNPVGNDPDATANDGAGNPDAVNVKVNGIEIVAVDGGVSAVNTGTDWIVIESDAEVTDPNTLPAEIVKVDVPVVVGVPDNTPVLELRLSPAGNDPDATLNVAAGYPDALNV